MKMKPEQERVKNLLSDTVTLLCKNGLQFSKELRVQGLIGITTDDNDVFVVHINETFGDIQKAADSEQGVVDLTEKDQNRPRKRPSSDCGSGSPAVKIKTEDGVRRTSCQEQQRTMGGRRDDRNAMQESYSDLSISDIRTGYQGNTTGISSSHRRPASSSAVSAPGKISGDSGSDTSNPYVTGFTTNQSGASNMNQTHFSDQGQFDDGGSGWDSSQIPPGGADDPVGIFDPV